MHELSRDTVRSTMHQLGYLLCPGCGGRSLRRLDKGPKGQSSRRKARGKGPSHTPGKKALAAKARQTAQARLRRQAAQMAAPTHRCGKCAVEQQPEAGETRCLFCSGGRLFPIQRYIEDVGKIEELAAVSAKMTPKSRAFVNNMLHAAETRTTINAAQENFIDSLYDQHVLKRNVRIPRTSRRRR